MKKFTVVNGRDVLYDGIVVARCLTGVTSEKEVTMKDAEKLAETICAKMNSTTTSGGSSSSSTRNRKTKKQ